MEQIIVDKASGKKNCPSFFSRLIKQLMSEYVFAIGSIPFIWQVVFFFLPLLVISATAFFDHESHFFSLHAFQHVCTLTYLTIAFNSLALASATTFLCLLLGFPLAYFMAFNSARAQKILLFLLIIPFWTNFILHIYAWFFVLEKNGFLNNFLLNIGLISSPLQILNSPFAVLLMMIYFYLPFMVLPIFSSLERFDTKLLEASLDLGANRAQTIGRILLPIISNAIKSGIFLVFIPSFGEFVIPELMGGDKMVFVGNVISLFILGKSTASYGVAFTLLCTLILMIALIVLNYTINRLSCFLAGGRK